LNPPIFVGYPWLIPHPQERRAAFRRAWEPGEVGPPPAFPRLRRAPGGERGGGCGRGGERATTLGGGNPWKTYGFIWGLRENLQDTKIFNGKIHGFL